MLFLDSGASGHSPRRDIDPTPALQIVPDPRASDVHGALFACADGLTDRPTAEQAAHDALTALGASFRAAPETWELTMVLEECVRAAHHTLRHAGERGRAASLSALVLRRRQFRVAHAGHTRVWLYRDNRLRQLTHDHLVPRPIGRSLVSRACGLETELDLETTEGTLHEGDVFLVTTAGVHDVLDGTRLLGVLNGDGTAQQLAEALVRRAREAGASGGMSACVVRVEKLPRASTLDNEPARALPIIPPPAAGAEIDDFTIDKRLHKGTHYVLYRATDRATGETVVLKFPQPGARDDAEVARRFLREEWILRRLASPHFVSLKPLAPGRRSALYSVMAYQPGENLARRIKRKRGLALTEARDIGLQLLDVLATLHQQGIVHRDVRPSNLLYDKREKRLLVLGLGASRIDALRDDTADLAASALSYAAPEVLRGEPANERSDVYAVGVTLYRLVTGGFPYGNIHQPTDWPRHAYAPLADVRSEVPEAWDALIRRACAPEAADRYGGAAQFAAALAEIDTEPRKPQRQASAPPAPLRPQTRPTPPWHWALIATLLIGLLAYLYVAVR